MPAGRAIADEGPLPMTKCPNVPIAIGATPPNCQASFPGGKPVNASLKIAITPNRNRGFTTYPAPTSCVIPKRSAADTTSEPRGPTGPANVTSGTANNAAIKGRPRGPGELEGFSGPRSVGARFESTTRLSVKFLGPCSLSHCTTGHRERKHGPQRRPCRRSQLPWPNGPHKPNDSPRLSRGSAT
jgi:hypothetical protein